MPAMIFDKACGCIELRTGCLIIGYLELVGEILFSIMLLIILAGGTAAVATAQSDHKEEQQALGGALLAVGVIGLLVLALLLGFTITLLVGLHKNKRGHVKAYLIYAAIFLVLGVLGFFGSFARAVDAGSVIGNLIGLALHFYFLLVIRSYYHKMDDGNKGQIYNTA